MRVRAQGLIDMVEQRHVGRVVEATRLQAVGEHLLALGHARLGERGRLVLLVDHVVARQLQAVAIFTLHLALVHFTLLQPGHDAVHLVVEVGGLLGRARDDEGRARLVDEDAVDFVHDRVVVRALHHARDVELHVVAEVVEAELVVRAVGDVAGVRCLPLLIVQLVLHDTHRHPEEAVDASHPLGVAAGQVVVDRDDVHALALERVQVGGQRRDERLAFAGLHLGDGPVVQDDAADELHVVVPHLQDAAAGLAHDGKRFGQQVVQRFALRDALLEDGGLTPQFLVGERSDLALEAVDAVDNRTQPLDFAIVLSADDLGEQVAEHGLEGPNRSIRSC